MEGGAPHALRLQKLIGANLVPKHRPIFRLEPIEHFRRRHDPSRFGIRIGIGIGIGIDLVVERILASLPIQGT